MGSNALMVLDQPVLFLHGFWGQASDFDFIQGSKPAFKVDSLEYTQDPKLGPHLFLSDWGAEFLNWTQAKGLQQPLTAVGYSQGGRLLLQAFQQSPDRFKKLILISSHPGLQSFAEKEARLKSDRSWAQAFRAQPWDELQVRWNAQPVFKGGVEKPRVENDFDRETLAQCLENWSLAHQQDFRNLIQNHQNKIEIIVGSEDQKYVELYESLGVKFQKAKGAAHRVPSDQPSILVEILNSIIKGKPQFPQSSGCKA